MTTNTTILNPELVDEFLGTARLLTQRIDNAQTQFNVHRRETKGDASVEAHQMDARHHRRIIRAMDQKIDALILALRAAGIDTDGL